MAGLEATPVIVGVGDVVNRSLKVEDAREPLTLMLEAVSAALGDTGLCTSAQEKLRRSIESIDVVATWTWPYSDLPGLLAENLNATPEHKFYSPHGGNQPAKLLDEAARRISLGECNIALVTGGEALASCS